MADPRGDLLDAELPAELRRRVEARRRQIRRDSRRLALRQMRTHNARDPEVARAARRRDGHVCRVCERERRPEVDHRVPLWAGGPDTIENAWVLCGECHREKTRLEDVSLSIARVIHQPIVLAVAMLAATAAVIIAIAVS